ncbi:MAG TPA: protein kinase [Archangium sp.]|nr:protein kinase [Archangium sp.]
MDSTLTYLAPNQPSGPPTASLPAGTVIAGRFTVEAFAGRGGMGTVYRATDALSGQRVALKLLHVEGNDAPRRFTREAELLSRLRHPGIVAHVAHGTADTGQPFLAMEWLEGETLAQRLSYEPLRLEETLALLRRCAEVLAVTHQQDVIHRDLKPSNLFLRQGRPEDVVLLDFGLARHTVSSTVMTVNQMVLGTPGYMAPEQVSGQSQLTPSADIFSLGCVLYECLTGQPPFSAPHMVASLAKSLFTEPPPLRELRPQLPSAFQELLAHMLAKEPARRLPDAQALLNALGEHQTRLEAVPGTATFSSAPLRRLVSTEQQLVTVLLAAPRATAGHDPNGQDSRLALRDFLRTQLAPQRPRVELLADGSLVLTLVASLGSATDPAALAARCALSLMERWPQAAVALTTGRGSLDAHLPMGEAMDRASQLLRQAGALSPASAPVLLDEVTAGLLGPGFQLTRPQAGLFVLHGEQLGADESRPLLGKPTPCVGREHELALLDMAFSTCVEESTAQAVLVTAPAGAGKSRLRHEFLRRLERREPSPLVLLGRGDPMSTGSADGLLGQALRRLCGISGGEPLEERRARLSQRLSQHLPEARAREVVPLLGELCAIPFPDEQSPLLRAARGDPRTMNLQLGRAWRALLEAECAHHPVLLVLEDLHWGDPLSIKLLDDALRELSERPLLVLALARPEVEQLLPGTWRQRMQEVPLRGLSRKACARLVREVLGEQLPEPLVDRLVEQAAGNALFLEELIRAMAEGRGEGAPATVLAMLQARLSRLEPGERQVMLAASLFGRSFWAGGVKAVLGQGEPLALERRLQLLEELEFIQQQPTSRFPSEVEYRFRHALVRDAVYELVSDDSKPVVHRLAGAWLEGVGERNPGVLAEHAQRGQQLERAIHFHGLMAEQLLNRHDLQGVLRGVEAALACGPDARARAHLSALRAIAALWSGDMSELGTLRVLLPELKAGGFAWCKLMEFLIISGILSPRAEGTHELADTLWSAPPEEGATAAYIETACFMAFHLSMLGARREALAWVERMGRLCAEGDTRPLSPRAWTGYASGFVLHHLEPRPWRSLLQARQSCQLFREMGWSEWIGPQVTEGLALTALGEWSSGVATIREGLAASQRIGDVVSFIFARSNLTLVLSGSPETAAREEARTLAQEALKEQFLGAFFLAMTRLSLARVALACGELAEAEEQARQALEPGAPYHGLWARTVLSAALLARGRVTEAREEAFLAGQELEHLGDAGAASVGLHLTLAEVYFSAGDSGAGEAALRRALHCVRSRVIDIPDATARERFLQQVPENARALALARQRWGGTEVP